MSCFSKAADKSEVIVTFLAILENGQAFTDPGCPAYPDRHYQAFLFIMEEIKNIIESLLLVAGEPLTIDRINNILTLTEKKRSKTHFPNFQKNMKPAKGGFFLREVAGGYQIRTRPEYREWIKRLIQPKALRLSKAALETLAIIAYKQPIIRSDIEHVRGVNCGGILRMLLERRLIRILGKKEIPGRPLIYATTKQFLEVFDLKDLKDLPTPEEIDNSRRKRHRNR